MNKKMLIFLLILVMLFSFTGCADEYDLKKDDSILATQKEQSSDTEKTDTTEPSEDMSTPGIESNGGESLTDAQIGDIVKFGHYEQDNDLTNGKEEIEWLVLDKVDGKLFVISKYALDGKPYNETDEAATWETCTIRKWLNENFYDESFSDEEKAFITTSNVTADKNFVYNTDPGNDTQDKVFLLSMNEADTCFASKNSRMCDATVYAKTKPMTINDSSNSVWWMLRTLGSDNFNSARVKDTGDLYDGGNNTISEAVRPAMWISTDVSTADEDDFSEFKKMSSYEIYENLIKPAEEIYTLVNLGDGLSFDQNDYIMVNGAKWYKVADEKMNTVEACRKYFSEYFSAEYTKELIKNFTEFAKISNGYLYMIGHGSGGNTYYAYEDYSIKSCEENKIVIQRCTYYIDEELYDASEQYREDEYNKTGESIDGRDLPKEYLSEDVDTYLYNYIYEDGKWVFDNFDIGWM